MRNRSFAVRERQKAQRAQARKDPRFAGVPSLAEPGPDEELFEAEAATEEADVQVGELYDGGPEGSEVDAAEVEAAEVEAAEVKAAEVKAAEDDAAEAKAGEVEAPEVDGAAVSGTEADEVGEPQAVEAEAVEAEAVEAEDGATTIVIDFDENDEIETHDLESLELTQVPRRIRRGRLNRPLIVALAVVLVGGVTYGSVLLARSGRTSAVTVSSPKHGRSSGHRASSPGATKSTPTTVAASAPTTVSQSSPSSSVMSPPGNGTFAVVSVALLARQVILDNGQADLQYPACSGFHASSPGDRPTSLSRLAPGDFVTAAFNRTGTCVASLSVQAPPAVAQCTTPGSFGDVIVTWVGANKSAHSVLYEGATPGSPVQAVRWCGAPPSAVGPNQAPIALSKIPAGATVTLALGYNQWVTGVSVQTS